MVTFAFISRIEVRTYPSPAGLIIYFCIYPGFSPTVETAINFYSPEYCHRLEAMREVCAQWLKRVNGCGLNSCLLAQLAGLPVLGQSKTLISGLITDEAAATAVLKKE